MIEGLKRVFPEHVIGYSDHTLPDDAMTPLVAAFLLGAVVLEKHFTHDKNLPGNDHYHAMDINDLARFVGLAGTIETLLGKNDHKEPTVSEELSRKNARRSIIISRNLPAGHILTAQDITYKRPGTGISPMHWDEIIGKKLSIACEEDHILRWQDLVVDA
jgi:N-acetylneuraminate synthase